MKKLSENDIAKLLREARSGHEPNKDLRYYVPGLIKTVQTQVKQWQPLLSKPNRPAKRCPFQLLDFFSGCGGMTLGFAALAKSLPIIEIIGACDIQKDALATYTANFACPAINQDIRDLAEDDEKLSGFLAALPAFDANRPTILIGCAPCQGFTSHRKRHWDKSDPRNSLLAAFAVIASKINPACIIMENVPEMLSHKYWSHFEAAREILTSAGYRVAQSIYNAAAFGVPQERFRTLVVAMKKNFLLPDTTFLSPKEYRSVRDAIGSLPTVIPGISNSEDPLHRCASHRASTLATIRAVPKNGGMRPVGVGPKCLDRVNGFSDVYGRLSWDKPAITITHYARNPASGRYVHPEQDRGLTTREAALLQSFPTGFRFVGTFDSVFRQIGEAVPPLFAGAIAAHCVCELLSKTPTKTQMASAKVPVTTPVNSSYSSVIAGIKMGRSRS
jgi:DNA (cytosine-5)-methyltransferase 1